jgi:nitrogen fixation protein NifU and related proteins
MLHRDDGKMDDTDLAERLLDHAESPYHFGACPAGSHIGEIENPSCGDWVRVELRIDLADRIAEAWFQSRGCLISRASGSMLVEAIEGKPASEISAWAPATMLQLFGAPLTARRQTCCLLALFALQRALKVRGKEVIPDVVHQARN